MQPHKFLGILLVAPFVHCTEVTPDGSSLSNLLTPQVNFQITLRVPEMYTLTKPALPPSVNLAIDLLQSANAPFRLFYNLTETKLWSAVPRPPRLTQNQVVWLVFVGVESKLEMVDLHEVFQSCSWGTDFGLSAAIHNDLIQLIVDESAVADKWDMKCDFNIIRAFFPMYFVMISWPSTQFTSQDAVLLGEACKRDDSDTFLIIRNFIPRLSESNGMENILKQIRSEKKDF